MTKQQIQIGVIIFCLTVIAGVLGKQFLAKKNSKESAAAPGSPVASHVAGTKPAIEIKFELPALSREIVQRQALGVQAPWGRDPFVLKTKTTPQEAQRATPLVGVSISAIIMRGDVGMAMVNQEIVHLGDDFRGHKVVKIDRSGIVLEREGQQVIIPYAK